MRTGTPFSSQSVARRPKLVATAASRRDPHARGLQVVDQPVGGVARAVLVPDEQTTTWVAARRGGTTSPSSSPWAMISPPTMRVVTPHDVVQHELLAALVVEVADVEGLGEVLAELVAGAHLQRLAVAHHRLDTSAC